MYERDEGRYADVANQMLLRGDLVHPRLERESLHWTKPPLTYWAIAASLKIFGHKEFAARFPGALAFLLTIVMVYGMARIFVERRSWTAPVIYSSFLFPCVASNAVSTDGLLTLWMTAAVFAFTYAMWGDKSKGKTTWTLAIWLFLALAFMTKGPVGLLPLVVIGAYFWLTPGRERHGKLHWLPGIGIFLLVTIPWFVVVIRDYPDLFDRFVVEETIARVAGKHHRNAQWFGPIVIYGPVLLFGTLPWTYWILRDGYLGIKKLTRKGRGAIASMRDQTRFLLLWFVVPMVVFTVIRSRLPLYILPVFVPLSLLLARKLCERSHLWTPQRIRLLGAWFIILLLVRGGVGLLPSKYDSRNTAHAFESIPRDQYDEVVFYDLTPQYGLSFYLGKDVEWARSDTVADELQDGEKNLWVVEPSKEKELKGLISQFSKVQLIKVGKLQSRYLILQECSDKSCINRFTTTK